MDSKDPASAEIGSESFADLLARRAPFRDLSKWFSAQMPADKPSAKDWTQLVVPVASSVQDLDWLTNEGKAHIRSSILRFLKPAFTELWDCAELQPEVIEASLRGFLTWMESLPDRVVVRFCWGLLAFDPGFTPWPVWWLKRSGRLAGPISYDHLNLAVTLAREADAMFWWPKQRWAVMNWERAAPAYADLLSHSSYLVRAAAAKCLGRVFYSLNVNAGRSDAPGLSDILSRIQQHEEQTPGVAGPFFEGAQWSIAWEEWSSFSSGIDMNTWILETLRRSGRELEVPHHQSLEFYAHELFAFDAAAIQEFLAMGRKWLAVLTATENPGAIPTLLPTLREMVSSEDPAVSAAIQEYLTTEFSHAGMEHLNAPGDEFLWF